MVEPPVHRLVRLFPLFLGLALGACGPAPRSLVVVLVDTLRADHVGAYGYSRPTSPTLDALAREGVLFRAARSQAPCTFPSVNSLLTSRPPLEFLGQPEGRVGIPEGMISLPEILQGAGYRTGAVSASPVVRQNPTRFNPAGGFERGFDLFDESCMAKDGSCVAAVAERFLDEVGDQPYFLYLHFYDPHEPYRPPADAPRHFVQPYEGPFRFVRGGNLFPVARGLRERGDPVIGEAEIRHLIELYDEEIRYWDDQLARVLDQLAARGLADHTVVAVLSDHGESFLEHGSIAHCRTVYEPEIRIPLVLRFAGGPRGVTVEAPVSLLDVEPTLLDLLGVEVPGEAPLQGRSLRPLWEGSPSSSAPSFASMGQRWSAAEARYKLTLDLQTRAEVLFDLAEDPGETTDVGARFPEERERLRRALSIWMRESRQDLAPDARQRLVADEEKRLQAVGYLK